MSLYLFPEPRCKAKLFCPRHKIIAQLCANPFKLSIRPRPLPTKSLCFNRLRTVPGPRVWNDSCKESRVTLHILSERNIQMSANRGIWADLQYVLLGGDEGASECSSSTASNAKSFEHCLEDLDWLLAMQTPDVTVPDSD